MELLRSKVSDMLFIFSRFVVNFYQCNQCFAFSNSISGTL
jgi:hypothetical protein